MGKVSAVFSQIAFPGSFNDFANGLNKGIFILRQSPLKLESI